MITKILTKMIDYSNKNIHDINHLVKVHTFAKLIGEMEDVSKEELFIIEVASILHDIACALCREKYGNTNGKKQEIEGLILCKEFLEEFDISDKTKNRIVYLVSHHHTYKNVDGIDYQILLEADYIVNAGENGYSENNVKNTMSKIFKTKSGIKLLKSMFN